MNRYSTITSPAEDDILVRSWRRRARIQAGAAVDPDGKWRDLPHRRIIPGQVAAQGQPVEAGGNRTPGGRPMRITHKRVDIAVAGILVLELVACGPALFRRHRGGGAPAPPAGGARRWTWVCRAWLSSAWKASHAGPACQGQNRRRAPRHVGAAGWARGPEDSPSNLRLRMFPPVVECRREAAPTAGRVQCRPAVRSP
jgi:hypothetical protein